MNIVYLLPVYWPAIGGCELHTHELVKRLSERHSIKVITQITRQEDKPGDLWFGTLIQSLPCRKVYQDNKAHVIPLRVLNVERVLLYPFVRGFRRMEPISMEAIRQVFQRKIMRHLKGADIIHCIHNGASFYAHAALAAARKHGIPFVLTPLLQTHQALKESERHRPASRDRAYPAPHAGNLRALLSPMAYHDRFWLHACLRADALIAMTDTEKRLLAQEGVPGERIHAVGVGPLLSDHADGKAFRKRHEIGSEPIVLFLGRKHESKGIKEVLQSAPKVWADMPETRFLFVGPKEGSAGKIFAAHQEDRIIEIDQVSLQEKTDAVAACDILCMPSMNEALGGVFLEAWALGKPVIAGDTPPLRELTGHGKGGFLVNLEPAQIAEKIIALLNNRRLREQMGLWGKECVVSRYAWPAITEKMEQVYLNLLDQERHVGQGQ